MKRKGFTLVELLIVIVVIGILSAMMMMSSTEATTSAKASNIVSNLRNLKTAALAYYTDNMDYFVQKPTADLETGKGDDGRDHQNEIWGYLSNNSSDSPEKSNYKIVNSKKNDYTWWALAKITGSSAEQAAIKKKLAARAKSLGLRATDKDGWPNKDQEYTNQAWVALQVR